MESIAYKTLVSFVGERVLVGLTFLNGLFRYPLWVLRLQYDFKFTLTVLK